MRNDIHPKYQPTVFKDISTGDLLLIPSTVKTRKTVTYTDGKEYPLVELEITSVSHPFYTGDQKLVDTAGRIERYNKKYNISE